MCLLHQLEELLQYAPLRAFYAQHAREHSDFCPADSYSGLTDLMIPSRRVDTITFPTLLLSTFPAPIGCNSGFLSSGIRRQDRKVSMAFASFFNA